MRYHTLSLCVTVMFLCQFSSTGQAQEKIGAAKDAPSPQNSVRTKETAQRARQESEIEAAAFLALLTNPKTKPNPNSDRVLVLNTNHGDPTDLTFLKGVKMQGMVVRPFADIITKYVPFSKEPLDGGMMTYQEKATGAQATMYHIGRIRWASDNEVEVDWSVTSYPQFGLAGTYQVIRKKGKWIGTQIKPGSLIRS